MVKCKNIFDDPQFPLLDDQMFLRARPYYSGYRKHAFQAIMHLDLVISTKLSSRNLLLKMLHLLCNFHGNSSTHLLPYYKRKEIHFPCLLLNLLLYPHLFLVIMVQEKIKCSVYAVDPMPFRIIDWINQNKLLAPTITTT